MATRYLFREGVLSTVELEGNTQRDSKSFQIQPSAVTIGTYDGVHFAHRAIISTLVLESKSRGLRSVVITFEPHPRVVLGKTNEDPIFLLTTLEEKLNMLASLGVECIIVIEFTKEFSQMSADVFVEEVLVKQIGLKEIIIGYDHMFGKNRGGSIETLYRLAEKHGFAVKQVEEQKIDEFHLSSTAIRKFLHSGEIEQANKLLGIPYQLTAIVVEGDKRGRAIGFPTANLQVPSQKLIPKLGVYAVDAVVDGTTYRAMMNIGVRPTVTNNETLSVEVHLFGFEGDLYGKQITINFLSRLRDEKKFSGIEMLKSQLEKDKLHAQQIPSEGILSN